MNVSTWFQRRRQEKRDRLRVVLDTAERPMSFYELSRQARVRSAFTLRELDRLIDTGVVIDSWGNERHPRRYYRLADR